MRYPFAAEVLNLYARLAAFQADILPRVQEIDSLPPLFDELIAFVQKHGTTKLKEAADGLESAQFELAIIDYWRRQDTSSLNSFFARAVLQPFVAERKPEPIASSENSCPYCGHLPQVAVLRPQGHGNAVNLVCSLCMEEWNFRRGCCPGCFEGNEKQLEFYSANELDYFQVQVCRSCNSYIHCIDASKDPSSLPFVDELAALPLDVWAHEQGLEKIQPNLGGI